MTLFLFASMAAPLAVSAALNGGATSGGFNGGAQTGGFNGGATAPSSAGSHTLINPLGVNSFCELIIKLLEAVMVIGVPIAILFIVWAGFQFVLAQGKPEALRKARQNFLNVIIGLAIFVGASLIASVIIHTLEQLGVQGLNSCVPL